MKNFNDLVGFSCSEAHCDLDIIIGSNFAIHRRYFNTTPSFDVMQEDLIGKGHLLSILDEKFLSHPLIELNLL